MASVPATFRREGVALSRYKWQLPGRPVLSSVGLSSRPLQFNIFRCSRVKKFALVAAAIRDGWHDRLLRWDLGLKRDSDLFALLRNSAVTLFGLADSGRSDVARDVTDVLAQAGFAPDRCELANGDYLPNDRHPNARGYAKFAACARRSIEALAAHWTAPFIAPARWLSAPI